MGPGPGPGPGPIPPDGDGGGDDDDGRISSNLQAPLPIAPRDEISRSGKALTPTEDLKFHLFDC